MTQQQTIFLPSERLPAAPKERHAALREYFCDKDASAKRTHQGWEITLDWPEDAGRHVDPKLADGLAWWDQQLTRSGMAISTRRNGRILRTLYDSWTLHSWSEWLNRFDTPPTSIVILHVDDHRDIGSPRLFEEPGCWRDPITGDQVEISNPESISRAIRSGAIGMGSFLTPFLHAFPSSEVRHLCQPPKSTDTQDYRFDLVTHSDNLLDLDARRPAIQLTPSDQQTGPRHYRMTPKLGDWVSGIGDGPILLHIDMDYFNNRYEGDSDWLDRRRKLDPPLAIVLDTIDQMVDALGQAGLASRLEDVVVAYSPGFFPGELWQAADERLTAAFERWNVR